jgi:general secretion pathway protein J
VTVRRLKGFTLIEVMVALGIMVGVALTLWRSMSMSFEVKQKVGETIDRYHEGRQIMQRISRELRMAFLHAPLAQGLEGEDPTLHTQFKGEDDELFFASTSHLRLQAQARESDQAEIAYFLKQGDRSSDLKGRTLFRRESRRVDDKPDRGGAIWPVVEGVKEFTFEYWDDAKEVANDAWKRSWDSDGEEKDLLPARVRITLVLDQGEDRPEIRFVAQAAPKIRRPVSR